MFMIGRTFSGNRSILLVLLLLSAALLAPCRLHALDLKNMSLEELLNIEVQTVYSASRHNQKVTDAPSSVTIITARDIREQGYRTLADILRSTRGFWVTYDRNYAYLGVRGFGRPGDYNTRVLLMLDGHPLNDTIYDSAAIGTEFMLDLDLIERIEITRGPGSSLYGSNAFFGIINIVSRSGSGMNGGEAALGGGSFGTLEGRISYGTSWDGFDFLGSVSGYRSAGQDFYFPEFDPGVAGHDSRARNGGIASGADEDRSAGGFFKTDFGGVRLQGGSRYRRKEIPTASFGTAFNTSDSFTVDTHSYLEALYQSRESGGTSFSTRLAYDEYRYQGEYVSPFPLQITNRDDTLGRWWSGEAVLKRMVGEAHKATLGLSFKNNSAQNQKNQDIETGSLYLDDRRNSFNWAFFGQEEIRFDRFLISGGARYDYYETFGGTFNPRAGIMYHPRAGSAIKILYGRAFRSPNIYEAYYHDDDTAKPNAALQPETVDSYEVVFEDYRGSVFRSTVTAYYYDIDNLISLQVDPLDGLLQYQNTERVTARGVEVEFETGTPGGMRGVLHSAFQRAEDRRTGERLSNSPRVLANLTVRFPLSRLIVAGIEERYTSARRTAAESTVGGFTTTNLTISSQAIPRTLDVSASVYNIFDRQFSDPASGEHVQDAIPQDGRSYRIQATLLF